MVTLLTACGTWKWVTGRKKWLDGNSNNAILLRNTEKAMAPHSSTLAWKTPGWRSLEGCSPWGRWGSDTTERLHFHFSLPCIGEGNGNPLQCSCLENPRDGGAWWAAIYGVAQSQTRLKWLGSSSRVKTKSQVRETVCILVIILFGCVSQLSSVKPSELSCYQITLWCKFFYHVKCKPLLFVWMSVIMKQMKSHKMPGKKQ